MRKADDKGSCLQVLCNGSPCTPEFRRVQAYVPQEDVTVPTMSAAEVSRGLHIDLYHAAIGSIGATAPAATSATASHYLPAAQQPCRSAAQIWLSQWGSAMVIVLRSTA